MGKSWIQSLKGLSNLGFGSAAHIGLSIGTSSIKMVEMKKSGKTFQLRHFGVAELPDEAISNREIINAIAVTDAIRTLSSSLGISGASVCSSISGNSLIIKRMTLEVSNPRELQEQVFWEAEQYLPFDPAEVVMDFQVLSAPKSNPTEVVLVAAKLSTLEAHMACISGAGLTPGVMDTDYFALQHVFEANYPQNPGQATLLVDVGASAMKMIVVQDRAPSFTKDSALGGKSLTQEIQRALNLSFSDAEALKVGGQGGALPQEVGDLITQACDNTAQEVKRTIDFYNASSSGAPISSILMCGGAARLSGLSKVVEEQTGVPSALLNPFASMNYDPAVFSNEYISSIGPIAAVPIGLALRGAK